MVTGPRTQTGQGRPRPVCVVTTDGDPTADTVVQALHRLHVPVLRFDLADFPQRVQLDARFTDGRWAGTLTAHDRRVRLEDVGAVWWWHTGAPRLDRHLDQRLDGPAAAWVAREAAAGIAGTLASLDCLHLNHPLATHAAQCKPLALAAAARVGLAVPPTWIGNTPRDAAAFAADAGPIACKALTHPGIDEHGLFLSTTRITPAMLHTVGGTAHQLQQFLDKRFEVRLTVVGDRMFAARIDAHSPAARVDFRDDYNALTYQPVQVPAPIKAGVTAWMRMLGLHYAAIDLLVDHDDQWWGLDINPAGQYGWIQHHLPELDITGAIAALLANPEPTTGITTGITAESHHPVRVPSPAGTAAPTGDLV